MARATRWTALAVVAVGLLVVAGCDDGMADEPRRTAGEASPTSSPRASDAAGALSGYGLLLPQEATGAEVTMLPDQEDQGMLDVYRVTFTAPAHAVEQMCADAGINGPLVARSMTDADRELYGVDEVPDGARVCMGSRPDNYRQSLRILFWGDPASVIVMLHTMPVR